MITPFYNTAYLLRSGINDPKWITLNVTTKLGVEIKAMKIIMGPPEIQRFLESEKITNGTKAVLSTNFNPKSDDFRKKAEGDTGTWYFGRADMADLNESQLRAIEAYIKKLSVDWKRKRAFGKTSEDDRREIAKKLNPEAFKEFFEKHCEDRGWSNVICPV